MGEFERGLTVVLVLAGVLILLGYKSSVKGAGQGNELGRKARPFERLGNGGTMLYYALVFLVIAVIAGLLGFGAIAFAAAGIAKILFFIFLILFLVSLITHLGRGQRV